MQYVDMQTPKNRKTLRKTEYWHCNAFSNEKAFTVELKHLSHTDVDGIILLHPALLTDIILPAHEHEHIYLFTIKYKNDFFNSLQAM